MMKMVNRIRGSVELEITAVYPERFLNKCAQSGVEFWKVTRVDETQYRFFVTRSGLRKALRFADAQNCELRVISQKGLPFFTARFKKRYALIAGLVLVLAFALVMGQFIWEIEVVGNESVPDEVLLQKLSELGIKEGGYTGKINESVIKNIMLLETEELLWCALNIQGGRVTFHVRERTVPESVVPIDAPCDVVAGETGVLVRMDTLRGAPMVQSGQTVTKGQVLVSGVMEIKDHGTRRVHAMAYAQARTWHDVTAVMPHTYQQKTYTGNEKTRRAVIVLGKRINFYSDSSMPFDNCDKIVSVKTLRVPLGVNFPVKFVTETFAEYVTAEVAVDEGVASEVLEERLVSYLDQTGGEAADVKFAFENRRGMLGVRMTAELVQDIAVTSYLP
ncbi:MAG: sporulation protein YqfD [Oscillospiraceae bacterium]|jgi:similar to stage IV sporulation protein|nr:sporulation protein YqfD [Oscillospiraceae bacterium]